MRHIILVGGATAAIALTLTGCEKAAAAPDLPDAAQMTKVANETVAVWSSMDAAKIKAVYDPKVVAFDFDSGPLETDRATFDKAQDVFAAAKLDGVTQVSRNLQALDADTFVMSGAWTLTSSSTPANNGSVRCTDVFHKNAAGDWLVINEHCSAMPKPAPA